MSKVGKPFSDPRLVGYARVSTKEQLLDLQLDALRKAGVREENLWFDVMSGARTNRPGLSDAMLDARRGDTVVVWRLDRLGRNMRELLTLIERFNQDGIEFRSLTEQIDTKTAGGMMVLHIMAATSEFERGLIKARSKAGTEAAAKRGKRVKPYTKMTPAAIATAKAMFAEGKTVQDVAGALNVSRQSVYSRVTTRVIRELRRKANAKQL